jgi:hypothetical protein
MPDLRGLGAKLGGMRFRWKRLVRLEHGPANAWFLTALALLVYEHVVWRGVEAAGPVIRGASIAGVVAVAGWVTVRVLKKTGHLDDE